MCMLLSINKISMSFEMREDYCHYGLRRGRVSKNCCLFMGILEGYLQSVQYGTTNKCVSSPLGQASSAGGDSFIE